MFCQLLRKATSGEAGGEELDPSAKRGENRLADNCPFVGRGAGETGKGIQVAGFSALVEQVVGIPF